MLFAAEWGDLSQLLTISLVAKYGSPLSVFLGVLGGAARRCPGWRCSAGRVLLRYMRLSLLHYIAAGGLPGLAVRRRRPSWLAALGCRA